MKVLAFYGKIESKIETRVASAAKDAEKALADVDPNDDDHPEEKVTQWLHDFLSPCGHDVWILYIHKAMAIAVWVKNSQ